MDWVRAFGYFGVSQCCGGFDELRSFPSHPSLLPQWGRRSQCPPPARESFREGVDAAESFPTPLRDSPSLHYSKNVILYTPLPPETAFFFHHIRWHPYAAHHRVQQPVSLLCKQNPQYMALSDAVAEIYGLPTVWLGVDTRCVFRLRSGFFELAGGFDQLHVIQASVETSEQRSHPLTLTLSPAGRGKISYSLPLPGGGLGRGAHHQTSKLPSLHAQLRGLDLILH